MASNVVIFTACNLRHPARGLPIRWPVWPEGNRGYLLAISYVAFISPEKRNRPACGVIFSIVICSIAIGADSGLLPA